MKKQLIILSLCLVMLLPVVSLSSNTHQMYSSDYVIALPNEWVVLTQKEASEVFKQIDTSSTIQSLQLMAYNRFNNLDYILVIMLLASETTSETWDNSINSVTVKSMNGNQDGLSYSNAHISDSGEFKFVVADVIQDNVQVWCATTSINDKTLEIRVTDSASKEEIPKLLKNGIEESLHSFSQKSQEPTEIINPLEGTTLKAANLEVQANSEYWLMRLFHTLQNFIVNWWENASSVGQVLSVVFIGLPVVSFLLYLLIMILYFVFLLLSFPFRRRKA